ncbi:MAG: tetratricopeptide repeat protein [Acaryochloridaceae cyanobacterium RL_2_7]|nr:tetratricopeptide repeat protein [Acaryochloridaceae cyanobacterium RL_2_7]
MQLSTLLLEEGNETDAKASIAQGLAIKQTGQTLSTQQKEAQLYQTLASQYQALKQTALAITAQEKAVQLDPNLDRAYWVLGQLYGQSGQAKKSFQAFFKHTSKDSTLTPKEQQAIAYEKLSEILQDHQDWSGALKAYQAKLKRVPLTQRWQADTYALILVKNQQQDQALRVFQEFFVQSDQQPDNPKHSPKAQAHFALGRLLAREQYFSLAQDAFAKARELGLMEAPNLGYEYSFFKREQRYPEAIAYFEQLSQHYPRADYAQYLGSLYGLQADWDASLRYFKQSIQFDPIRDSTPALTPQEEAQAYIKLGNIMKDKSYDDLAQKAYETAIRLDDSAAVPWNSIAHMAWDRNQIPEAIQALREVIRRDPQFPSAHNALGLLLTQTGNDEEAIASFKNRPNTCSHRGRTHHQSGANPSQTPIQTTDAKTHL